MTRLVVACAVVLGCSHPVASPPAPAPVATTRTLTIIGTSDLHGALVRLPLLAGFIANVRAARAADGGGVLLVDAGDLFQGTLESNVAEGVDVVRAYNRLGYAASAIGNHEFDYGPVGPATTAQSPADDPRGALKARIAEAKFPFLVVDIADGDKVIAWPNVAPGKIVEVAGIKVGIVGASTESTPFTTMPANFKGLKMLPAASAIAAEARALRTAGAQLIVVIAHIGGECKDLDHPDDTSSCNKGDELFRVIDALPPGLVDVFVAGHTHAAVAHRIDGVAAIESLSSGRAFGRVDVRITNGHIDDIAIAKPQVICPLDDHYNPAAVADCHPAPYEGRPVTPDPAVQKIVDEALARAGERRAEKLGVTLAAAVTKAYRTESAEGDLFTELMLAANPGADVALANGGGLRADLPAGELTYGQLFEAMPFDNRFALVEVRGDQLLELVTSNLQRDAGIFSWAGLAAKARCDHGELAVALEVGGKPIVATKTYTIATSDFLASGGDGLFGHADAGAIKITDVIIRDAMADLLRKQRGTIDPAQRFAHPRLEYSGTRPVTCAGHKESKE